MRFNFINSMRGSFAVAGVVSEVTSTPAEAIAAVAGALGAMISTAEHAYNVPLKEQVLELLEQGYSASEAANPRTIAEDPPGPLRLRRLPAAGGPGGDEHPSQPGARAERGGGGTSALLQFNQNSALRIANEIQDRVLREEAFLRGASQSDLIAGLSIALGVRVSKALNYSNGRVNLVELMVAYRNLVAQAANIDLGMPADPNSDEGDIPFVGKDATHNELVWTSSGYEHNDEDFKNHLTGDVA